MQTMSAWRKSSYSGNGGQDCVEVAGAGTVLVRDTVNREGAMLSVTADAWSAFLAMLK
jgi:Domain of unknown function (DUF397)